MPPCGTRSSEDTILNSEKLGMVSPEVGYGVPGTIASRQGILSAGKRKVSPKASRGGILHGCSLSFIRRWVLERRSGHHERALRDRMDRCDVEPGSRLHE